MENPLPSEDPPRPPSTHEVGRHFEGIAAAWLEAEGWTVLDRNFRYGPKELDLVVRRDGVTAFVEVKGRTSDAFGPPSGAVTHRKRREVETVARFWLWTHSAPRGDHTYRFDVVTVLEVPGQPAVVEHLADAWRVGE